MRRLVPVFCLAALLAADRVAAADATLVVRVYDPHAAAVPGAHVTLVTRDRRVTFSSASDEAGRCGFDRLAPGDYLVDVTARGFARSRAVPVSVGGSGPVEIDVRLALAAFEEQTVVTAAGTLQTADETSKAVGALEAAALDAHGELWVGDALRGVPGVYVQQLGGPGSFTTVKSRGLRNEDTAVLIDGVRFRDAGAPQGDASGFLAEMVVTNVDRLEVLRGSGSSLHGSNAIGGALNLITRRGGGAPAGQALLETGSLGLTRARGQIGGGLRGDRIEYSVGATHVDVARGLDEDDTARQSGLQGRADVRLPANASLTVSLFGVDARSMVNESPAAMGTLPPGVVDGRAEVNVTPAANDPDNDRESRFLSARVAVDQRLGRRLGYTLAYHHVDTRRRYHDGPRGVTAFEPQGTTLSAYDGRLHALAARLDGQWSARHLTTAGYELESETFVGRSVPVSPAPESAVDVTQRSHTFFVQHQVRPATRLHLSAAARAQVFSLSTPGFTPADRAPYQGIAFDAPPAAYTADGSAAYLVGTDTKVRAHMGNGYRAPSLYERFGTFFGSFGYSVYGDPRLGPDRSLAWDAGLEQELAGGRVRASATYFHARLRRVIAFETFDAEARAADPFGRARGYRNADGRAARGVEVGLAATPRGGLHVEASYTFADSDPPRGAIDGITQAFGVPRHVFAAAARHEIGRWRVALDLRAAGSQVAPIYDPATFTSRAFRFDGRLDADAVVSYTLPLGGRRGLRAFAKVDHLAGGTAYEMGFRVPGRLVHLGAVLEF